MQKKLPIIYIMGSGRSGSTLLDIMIGNHKGFLSAGELNRLGKKLIENGICSCGDPVNECLIWKNVYRKYLKKHDQYYANFLESNRFILNNILNLYPPERIHAYNSYVFDIFAKLLKLSSSRSIVDSSNSVGRALSLLKNPKIDVRIIHLVRDPRGVYYSLQKKNVRSPVRGILPFVLHWNLINFFAILVKIIHGKKKVHLVRYENLVSKPDMSLDLIGNYLNEDFSDVKEKIRKKIPLHRGHICSGNRMRLQKEPLILKQDFEWETNLARRQRLIIKAFCLPLIVYFGYPT